MNNYDKRAEIVPLFLYSPTLLKTMSSTELEIFLSSNANRYIIKSQALCNIWKKYTLKEPIDYFVLSSSNYTIDDVAIVLIIFKKAVTSLTVSHFTKPDSQSLVKILKNFMLEYKVLESLNILSNQLRSEDIIEILKPVKDAGCLKKLDVSDNLIDAEGIKYIAEFFEKNGFLVLDISKNPFDSDSAEYLRKIIEKKWKPEQYNLDVSKQYNIYDKFVFELKSKSGN